MNPDASCLVAIPEKASPLVHASFVHLDVMVLAQVLFESYPGIHKMLRASFFLAEVFVTVIAVGEMRVFSETDMDSVRRLQMLGNARIASQMASAVLTNGHGWWFVACCFSASSW